ncbi:MAG: GNAT family N-acetyltransferase [Bauldia sp.]
MKGLFKPSRPVIENARPEDAAALAEIHEYSFPRGWTAEEMRRFIGAFPTVQPLVLRVRSMAKLGAAGFVIVRVAAGESEILTLAVRPTNRGRGYGRLLMEEAARRAYHDRAETMFLEVDESNRHAVALYLSLGFETVGSRSRYYEDTGGGQGTALVMRRFLR